MKRYTKVDLHRMSVQFQSENDHVPSVEELIAWTEEQERRRFVQVQFIGHAKTYVYEVRPGRPVQVDEYLTVFSPMTCRDELVKVVALGRGDWVFGTKIAHRVAWHAIDSGMRDRTCCCGVS